MGKDLRGKELGVGISQRKDGLYTGRYTDRLGNRHQKYFKKLQECRNWIADSQFQAEHGTISALGDMTLNAWFEYWLKSIKSGSIRVNTVKSYSGLYSWNIKNTIGDMLLSEIKPFHCQNVLNQMADGKYKNSTIALTRSLLCAVFDAAVENELIIKNPVTKSIKCTFGKEKGEKKVLTLSEQKTFITKAYGESKYYNQYAFILQTGLRTGEMIGLKWSDIDWAGKMLHVRRTMDYQYQANSWRIGEPKSKNGIRDIPLTEEAICILKSQKEKIKRLPIIPFEFSEYVFLNENGEPVRNSAYDSNLLQIAKKANIEPFSMHSLRHTFATRCIEGGMKPKTLQMILGHSNIGITMNAYVHVTQDERIREMQAIENMLNVL